MLLFCYFINYRNGYKFTQLTILPAKNPPSNYSSCVKHNVKSLLHSALFTSMLRKLYAIGWDQRGVNCCTRQPFPLFLFWRGDTFVLTHIFRNITSSLAGWVIVSSTAFKCKHPYATSHLINLIVVSWESHGNLMGFSRVTGISWESHRNLMGISWESHGNLMEISTESHGNLT